MRLRRVHTPALRIPALAATALAASLALAGCSSSANPSNGSNPSDTAMAAPPAAGDTANLPDPCSLLTADQVSAAVGATVQPGTIDTKVSQDGQKACEWTPGGDSPYPFVQVLITAFGDQLDSQRQSAQDAMGDVADVAIPGADGAYSFAAGSTIGMAIKGYFVQVAYNDAGVSDYATPAKELATEVAAAL